MADTVDTVIIGGGVVGLACARALAQAGVEVWLLEAASALGQGISSRSSEVIHAGLYYPESSLKAAFCCRGRELLYEFCAARGVGHRKLGKLIVAQGEGGAPELEALKARGDALGVPGLTLLSEADLRLKAPALRGTAALWSPETGIVDSQSLMLALAGEAEAAGAQLVLQTAVTRLALQKDGVVLEGSSVGAPLTLKARRCLNAAGFGAFALARDVLDGVEGPFYAAGHYFSYGGKAPAPCLVYPLPEPGGLGIHLTLDLGGQARFGPDVAWRESEDYAFSADRACFAAAIQSYFPGLDPERLSPAYVGLRPKRVGPGTPAADFGWQAQPLENGGGLLHLLGIESPGLTSALALGERVAAHWQEALA